MQTLAVKLKHTTHLRNEAADITVAFSHCPRGRRNIVTWTEGRRGRGRPLQPEELLLLQLEELLEHQLLGRELEGRRDGGRELHTRVEVAFIEKL